MLVIPHVSKEMVKEEVDLTDANSPKDLSKSHDMSILERYNFIASQRERPATQLPKITLQLSNLRKPTTKQLLGDHLDDTQTPKKAQHHPYEPGPYRAKSESLNNSLRTYAMSKVIS